MQSRVRRESSERGETLIELIVALSILGIAGVAIMTGLMVSVRASDQGRKEATGGAYARSWAEAIQSSVDDANALGTCSDYIATFSTLRSANPQLIPLSPACTATTVTNGIQKVTLKLTSAGDATHQATESLVVFLRTPCNAAGNSPCG